MAAHMTIKICRARLLGLMLPRSSLALETWTSSDTFRTSSRRLVNFLGYDAGVVEVQSSGAVDGAWNPCDARSRETTNPRPGARIHRVPQARSAATGKIGMGGFDSISVMNARWFILPSRSQPNATLQCS